MTEQHFQTPPLPPQAPAFSPAGTQPTTSVGTTEAAVASPATEPVVERGTDDFATKFKLPKTIYKTKAMLGILAGAVVVGLLLGALFFGGSGKQAPATNGLGGIIWNPDIMEPLQRCGMVPESYPCVVYIVNHSRNDRLAEYFFDEASHLTGRQKFMVQIANKQYANMRIPRGHIAQISIPQLQ